MRSIHQVYNTDPAHQLSYVSKSTIPGADFGLFVSRYFDGNDNDEAYVGKYFGGEHLTQAQIHAPGHYSDYAIESGH